MQTEITSGDGFALCDKVISCAVFLIVNIGSHCDPVFIIVQEGFVRQLFRGGVLFLEHLKGKVAGITLGTV